MNYQELSYLVSVRIVAAVGVGVILSTRQGSIAVVTFVWGIVVSGKATFHTRLDVVLAQHSISPAIMLTVLDQIVCVPSIPIEHDLGASG